LGPRKNKRKPNQTRAKGKLKVWMKVSYKVEFHCVVIVGMWINFQLCKLTWFQLVFNFNKCNSNFGFLNNTLPPLLYVISFIDPYYLPYYPFVHSSILYHPSIFQDTS
jgi:hypothetical protein